MGLFLWIFAFGLVNLGVGYALAVVFGYVPPTLAEAWRRLGDPSFPTSAAPPSGSPPPISLLPEPPPDLGIILAPAPLEDMLDAGPDGHFDVEPYDEPYDDDVAELLTPPGPEAWDLNEKYVETSVLKLNIAMIKSGARATEIDTRLRACKGRSDPGTIQRCFDELVTDCEIYLAEQSEAAEKFRSRIGELGELAELGDQIEMANLEQAAQIETTLSNLRHMDPQADLEAANAQLLTEIHRLRAARHRLRDSQEIAFLTIARYEGRLDKIESQLFNDPLTRLRNRIGLETTLSEWWRQGRHHSRAMSAALVDFDAFGRINQHYGSLIGDRALAHLAQIVQQVAGPSNLPARYAGQRFFVMVPDAGPHATVKMAELVRQSIARTTFRHGGEEIRLTACAGVVEVSAGDTVQTLLARVEETLQEAKRAGPDHACLHDGQGIQPIESPNLGAEYREIDV